MLSEVCLRLRLTNAWLASQIVTPPNLGKVLTMMDDWRNVNCEIGTTAGSS